MNRQRYSPYREPRAPQPVEAKPKLGIGRDDLEVTLSKGDALKYDMNDFTIRLSEWAERMATKGYRIESVPDEGPGTMRWRATR